MAGTQMPRLQTQQQKRPIRGVNAADEDNMLLDFIPDDGRGARSSAAPSPIGRGGGEHKTKLGTPDRRFKGQRDLPPEEVDINPNYVRPTAGGTLPDGTHITRFGKPDLRFKENRAKDEETVLAEWAEKVYETYGRH